jgi:hypothetical protein
VLRYANNVFSDKQEATVQASYLTKLLVVEGVPITLSIWVVFISLITLISVELEHFHLLCWIIYFNYTLITIRQKFCICLITILLLVLSHQIVIMYSIWSMLMFCTVIYLPIFFFWCMEIMMNVWVVHIVCK